MERRAGIRQRLAEPVAVSLVVFLGKKASRAVVAALDDVVRVVGNVQARASWHALRLAEKINRAWPL
jgi:hypothetical protein